MLLTVSLGNTNVSFGVFDGLRLVRHDRIPPTDLARLAERIGAQGFERVAVASVAPSRTGQAISSLAAAYGGPILLAGEDLPYGIEIQCDEPSKVGADRLLNAIAAYARTRKATIVVDVGTTITVDLVSERGNFCGGAIAPGPSTMMAALHEHTELLPAVTFDRPSSPLGRNTAAAMRSGAYWGTVGLVERLVSEMAREATGGPPVIFTGGAAEFVAREMKTKIELIPALTLEGLAILAAKA